MSETFQVLTPLMNIPAMASFNARSLRIPFSMLEG